MTTIYREKDGDLSLLKNVTIGMIGYGNQSRSQALNLRDQGATVIVGNKEDDYKKRAEEDGFITSTISEVVMKAQVLFFLIPDEIMGEVFEKQIRPYLKQNDAIIFASGYNIAFGLISPPEFIDVLLVAPRMIGIGVRETFLNKEGYFSFIGVHQDASGHAKEKLLTLSKGVGGLAKAGIEVSFKEEAVLDLFSEQGFGPAFSQIMMKPISILLNAGYPEEAVLIEMVLSGKMKRAFKSIKDHGIINQIHFMSKRAQYGAMIKGLQLRNTIDKIVSIQKTVIENIENGGFAKEWEKVTSKIKFKFIKFMASKVGFAKLEKRVRTSLGMPEVDLWKEVPYPSEKELKQSQILKKEMQEFRNFPEF